MKALYVFFVISLITLSVFGQTNFQRYIGGLGQENGHAVTVTQDGGYAIAGKTNSFGAGLDDIFIVKLNHEGLIQWQKTYGGSAQDEGMSIEILELPNGDLVVTGGTRSFEGHFRNLYLFKTDANGVLLWSRMYDSGPAGAVLTSDFGMGLLYTRDGNILISGTDDAHAFGSNDGLVLKVDTDGNLLWKRVYGLATGGNEHLQGMIELPGSNTLLTGSIQSSGPGSRAAYLLKLNPQGDIIWGKSYGGNAEEEIGSIDLIGDAGIVVTGQTNSFGAGNHDIFLMKLDTSGVVAWAKTYGGTGNDIGVAVKSMQDGSGYFISAYTDSFHGSSDRDILVIRTNAEGDVVWSRTYDSGNDDALDKWANACFELTEDGGFVLTGWSRSITADNQILVIKSDGAGNTLCEDVSLMVTSPEITTILTETESSEVGEFTTISSTTTNAAMISEQVCICVPDTACEKCERTIVHFDFDACYATINDGGNMDYSEFIPVYPDQLSYAEVSAGVVFRENHPMNKHSCTPGVEGTPAMCVGSLNSCTYSAGHIGSVVFEVTIVPNPDSAVVVSGLKFFEKAPQIFDWIGGASGPNNYPTLFGVRVLKNGSEIFSQSGLPTSVDIWQEEVFDFSDHDAFRITEASILRFELLGYCLIGNGATVDAWDLDEITVLASCEAFTGAGIQITGFVRNESGLPINGVVMAISEHADFTEAEYAITNAEGGYIFDDPGTQAHYYVNGLLNTHFLQGVSTLDLIKLQKHLLGLDLFQSPYQFIAGDVNRSNSLSALDIVMIRQLILEKITEFPDNTSWRFGNRNQILSMESPWDFKETIAIRNIGVDAGDAHFIAVKTGDVTGDAIDDAHHETVTERALQAKHLILENVTLHKGVHVSIPVRIEELNQIAGLQMSMKFTDLEVVDVQSGLIEITEELIHVTEGNLRMSWNALESVDVSSGEVLFTLHLLPMNEGSLSKMLRVENDAMISEIYLNDGEARLPLRLAFDGEVDTKTEMHLEIYPNPVNTEATISFSLETEEAITLEFFNPAGQLLYHMQSVFPEGVNAQQITMENLGYPTGVVFCQLKTSNAVASGKLIVLR